MDQKIVESNGENHKKGRRNGGTCCAAANCTHTRFKKPELSFFEFPRDVQRCARWMHNCRRIFFKKTCRDVATSNRSWQLCEEHFEPSQFMNPADKGVKKKGKRLRWDAVPTLFDVPNPPPKITITRKLPTRQLTHPKKGKTNDPSPNTTKSTDNARIVPVTSSTNVVHDLSEEPRSSTTDKKQRVFS